MSDQEPFVPTRAGFFTMHIVPPLIASLVAVGIGSFATINVLSERLAVIEERTMQAQTQIDRRFSGIESSVREKLSDIIRAVDANKHDTDRRLERLELRVWPMSQEPDG